MEKYLIKNKCSIREKEHKMFSVFCDYCSLYEYKLFEGDIVVFDDKNLIEFIVERLNKKTGKIEEITVKPDKTLVVGHNLIVDFKGSGYVPDVLPSSIFQLL